MSIRIWAEVALPCLVLVASSAVAGEPIQNLRGRNFCFAKDFPIRRSGKTGMNFTPIVPVAAKPKGGEKPKPKPKASCSVVTRSDYGLSKLTACPTRQFVPEGASKPKIEYGYAFGDPLEVRDPNTGKLRALLVKDFTRCHETSPPKGSKKKKKKEFYIGVEDGFHHVLDSIVCKTSDPKYDVCDMSIEDFRAATEGIVQLDAVGEPPAPPPATMQGIPVNGGAGAPAATGAN